MKKTLLQLVCLLPVLAGLLHAEVPRKPIPSKYRDLWQNSPFTTKPVTTSGPVYNPLQDYVLIGVSPIKGGYRVTMLNSKRPNDGRIILESDRPVNGIEIKEVMRKEGDPMGTKVRIARSTGSAATIGFEDKFLTLKAPPAAAKPQQPNNRVQPTAKDPAQPDPRVPRRRIIPPTSGGGQQGQGANSSNPQSGTNAPPLPPGTR